MKSNNKIFYHSLWPTFFDATSSHCAKKWVPRWFSDKTCNFQICEQKYCYNLDWTLDVDFVKAIWFLKLQIILHYCNHYMMTCLKHFKIQNISKVKVSLFWYFRDLTFFYLMCLIIAIRSVLICSDLIGLVLICSDLTGLVLISFVIWLV